MSSKLALQLGQAKTIMDNKQIAYQRTVYSDPFVVEAGDNFSVFLKAEGTRPRIRIVECYNPSTSYPPDSTQWAEVDESGEEYLFIERFISREWVITPIILNYSVWVRLKCTGLSANLNDTQLTMKIVKQFKEK